MKHRVQLLEKGPCRGWRDPKVLGEGQALTRTGGSPLLKPSLRQRWPSNSASQGAGGWVSLFPELSLTCLWDHWGSLGAAVNNHQALMHTEKQIKGSLMLGPGSSREGPGHLQAPICTRALAPGERGACTLSNKDINRRCGQENRSSYRRQFRLEKSSSEPPGREQPGRKGEGRRPFSRSAPGSRFWLPRLSFAASLAFSLGILSLILWLSPSLPLRYSPVQRPGVWRTSKKSATKLSSGHVRQ